MHLSARKKKRTWATRCGPAKPAHALGDKQSEFRTGQQTMGRPIFLSFSVFYFYFYSQFRISFFSSKFIFLLEFIFKFKNPQKCSKLILFLKMFIIKKICYYLKNYFELAKSFPFFVKILFFQKNSRCLKIKQHLKMLQIRKIFLFL